MEIGGQLHAPISLTPGKAVPVPIGQNAGWASESVSTLWSEENSHAENRTSGPSASSQSLYIQTELIRLSPHNYLINDIGGNINFIKKT
jgi:hypothetical protein